MGNGKYLWNLKYIHINISSFFDEWDGYQDIFDQCTNLKAIELCVGATILSDILPHMSGINQQIWKERISYFEARGIRLANYKEIQDNENLKRKVAKEAGVPWIFHFN